MGRCKLKQQETGLQLLNLEGDSEDLLLQLSSAEHISRVQLRQQRVLKEAWRRQRVMIKNCVLRLHHPHRRRRRHHQHHHDRTVSRHFNLLLTFRRVLTQGCRSLGLGQMRGNSQQSHFPGKILAKHQSSVSGWLAGKTGQQPKQSGQVTAQKKRFKKK